MEKPVILVGQQKLMEHAVLPTGNFSEKNGIASDVVLFSRFHRNDRNITEPFVSVTLAYHAPC